MAREKTDPTLRPAGRDRALVEALMAGSKITGSPQRGYVLSETKAPVRATQVERLLRTGWAKRRAGAICYSGKPLPHRRPVQKTRRAATRKPVSFNLGMGEDLARRLTNLDRLAAPHGGASAFFRAILDGKIGLVTMPAEGESHGD